jgi:hypothetical protein
MSYFNAILVAGWVLGFSLILLGAALLAFVALTTTASSLLIHWGTWKSWWIDGTRSRCYDQSDIAFEKEEIAMLPVCVLRSVRRLTLEFLVGLLLYGLVLLFLLYMDRMCHKKNDLIDNSDRTTKNAVKVPERPVESGDICPVCLDQLQNQHQQQPLEFCTYGCGKGVHTKCNERWMKKTRNDPNGAQCVYCRAPWEANKSSTVTKIMSLYTNRTEF